MIRFNITAALVACIISFLSSHSFADVVVIVNPSNSVSELDDKWLSAIFLGKKTKFPDGSSAVPIEQQPGTSARDKFNENIIYCSFTIYYIQTIFMLTSLNINY